MAETGDQNVRDRLQVLRQAYAKQLEGRMAESEAVAEKMRSASSPEEVRRALEELRAMAHRLAGSGATFGYSTLGEVASELEGLCAGILSDDGRPCVTADHQAIKEIVDRLLLTAAAGPDTVLPEPESTRQLSQKK